MSLVFGCVQRIEEVCLHRGITTKNCMGNAATELWTHLFGTCLDSQHLVAAWHSKKKSGCQKCWSAPLLSFGFNTEIEIELDETVGAMSGDDMIHVFLFFLCVDGGGDEARRSAPIVLQSLFSDFTTNPSALHASNKMRSLCVWRSTIHVAVLWQWRCTAALADSGSIH